mmetsp:Transcript_10242/g.17182  ORF Transcript_10242/g.17182 Transcript_10242/m.17182 type:complete len:224 (-) Transcript_10242:19-690(-)
MMMIGPWIPVFQSIPRLNERCCSWIRRSYICSACFPSTFVCFTVVVESVRFVVRLVYTHGCSEAQRNWTIFVDDFPTILLSQLIFVICQQHAQQPVENWCSLPSQFFAPPVCHFPTSHTTSLCSSPPKIGPNRVFSPFAIHPGSAIRPTMIEILIHPPIPHSQTFQSRIRPCMTENLSPAVDHSSIPHRTHRRWDIDVCLYHFVSLPSTLLRTLIHLASYECM